MAKAVTRNPAALDTDPDANPFTDAIEKLRTSAKARNVQHITENPTLPAKQQAQLPLWPNQVRGLPNALARSSLFTIGNPSDPREQFTQKALFALNGVNILYTGAELRQDDEDVFLAVAHLSRLETLGERVEFTPHSMLKALKWDTGGEGYDRLRNTLDRLQATTLMVTVKDMKDGYTGSLVRRFAWRDGGSWSVMLEPDIVSLFGDTQYTWVDFEQRMKLSGIAKKLHSFYFTHRTPFPLKVGTLKDLCRSRLPTLAKFRYQLWPALDRLIKVGFLESWSYDKDSDLVYVARLPAKLSAQGAVIEVVVP